MEIFTGEIRIPESGLTCEGLLRLCQDIAGEQCRTMGMGWEDMQAKGLFWAVIRNRVEICRPGAPGECITLRTWPMPTTRVSYPRSVEAIDGTGQVLWRAHSVWALMDTHKRSLVLPKDGVAVEGILTGTELPAPALLRPVKEGTEISRTVARDDLDDNGHMNNCRYLSWVMDCLPSGFRPGSVTLSYMNEACLGQALTLRTARTDDGFCTDILRGDERIFAAKLCPDGVL